MKVRELKEWLYERYPLDLQESYDNCGLTIGNETNEVSGILVTLDITEDVLEEAKEKNCNVVVAHHPLIFRGVKSLTGKTYIERCVAKAIKNDISVFAMHTNVDNSELGTSFELAKVLGLTNLSPLDKDGEKAIGCMGDYDGEDFAQDIKERLGLKMLKYAGKRKVKKVGIVTGSGSEYYGIAKAKGCDVFVSGDFKYHQYFDAIDGPAIADVGHYESEIYAKEIFFRELSSLVQHNDSVKVYRSEVNTNPVCYI